MCFLTAKRPQIPAAPRRGEGLSSLSYKKPHKSSVAILAQATGAGFGFSCVALLAMARLGEDSLEGLTAYLHGKCLRLVASRLNGDFDGLTAAAREARRKKIISNKLAKQLERLDITFAMQRHFARPKAERFFEVLYATLTGQPVHDEKPEVTEQAPPPKSEEKPKHAQQTSAPELSEVAELTPAPTAAGKIKVATHERDGSTGSDTVDGASVTSESTAIYDDLCNYWGKDVTMKRHTFRRPAADFRHTPAMHSSFDGRCWKGSSCADSDLGEASFAKWQEIHVVDDPEDEWWKKVSPVGPDDHDVEYSDPEYDEILLEDFARRGRSGRR